LYTIAGILLPTHEHCLSAALLLMLVISKAKANAYSDIFHYANTACSDYDELGSLLPEPKPPLCSTFNLSPVHLLLTLCIVGSTAAAAVAIACSTAVSGGVLHVWTVCGSTVGLLIGYTLPAGMLL
jgi:hypothetical protein